MYSTTLPYYASHAPSSLYQQIIPREGVTTTKAWMRTSLVKKEVWYDESCCYTFDRDADRHYN